MKIIIILVIASALALSRGQKLPRETYSNTNKFPSENVCGKPFLDVIQTVIHGGSRSTLGAHPWMANIKYKDQNNVAYNSQMCDGSLITDRHILTAAHCLTPEHLTEVDEKRVWHQWKPVAVLLGDLDTNPSVDDGATPEVFDIDKYIWHGQYSTTRQINDIGLITLKNKVVIKDLIRPICLPPTSLSRKLFVGENLTVAGWGKNENGKLDTHLLEVDIPVNDCKTWISSVDDKVICAGSHGKDSCKGDSGGPLMYLDRKTSSSAPVGTWYQIGIVSYGYGMGRKACGLVGVYTRVSQYMSWIEANVNY